MTGTQATSHGWNWCIPTSRVFETRIFLSSNFKKMRKYRFYWWSYFVYLFMIEVLNDFGLLKRIYVFWSKGDPVGTGYQSDRLPSRTEYPIGLGTQSGLGTSPTGYPVRLGDRSDWYPVTQSGTGTGASLDPILHILAVFDCFWPDTMSQKMGVILFLSNGRNTMKRCRNLVTYDRIRPMYDHRFVGSGFVQWI